MKPLHIWHFEAVVHHHHGSVSGDSVHNGYLVTPHRTAAPAAMEVEHLLLSGRAPDAASVVVNALSYQGAALAQLKNPRQSREEKRKPPTCRGAARR